MVQAEPSGDTEALCHLPTGPSPSKLVTPRHRAWPGSTGTVYPASPDSKDQPNNTLLFIEQLHISRPTDA